MVIFGAKEELYKRTLSPPLLFCFVEDVLSRGITKLVQQGKVELIKCFRKQVVPSHTLYVDDMMRFYKGNFHS